MRFRELDTVRVVRLLTPDRPYDGSESSSRPPRVGDTGVVVWVDEAADASASYMVECVREDGYTVWLADFHAAELERVTDKASQPWANER